MNDPDLFKNPCPICKKRKATRLCDYVTEYIWTTLDFRATHMSCDLPLCEGCATKQGPYDFCPHHDKLHQQRDLPPDLKRIANMTVSKRIWDDHDDS